jgi:hypothetical protein
MTVLLGRDNSQYIVRCRQRPDHEHAVSNLAIPIASAMPRGPGEGVHH